MCKKYLLPLFLCFLVAIAGCSDGRPDSKAAKSAFEKIYPGVAVTKVSISEDEVAGRSYIFRYRKLDTAAENEIEIQFMQEPVTKAWEPSPRAPKQLP